MRVERLGTVSCSPMRGECHQLQSSSINSHHFVIQHLIKQVSRFHTSCLSIPTCPRLASAFQLIQVVSKSESPV